MPYELEDIAGMVLSFLTIDDGYALVEAWNMGPELMKRRTDPVAFVSRVFRYGRSLLAAMADEGCVLAGSHSLEFHVPGSVDEDSDWDMYVPGNLKAITNMLAVLQECGVQWQWPGETYDNFIRGPVGTVVEFRPWHIGNICQWDEEVLPSLTVTAQIRQRVALAKFLKQTRRELVREMHLAQGLNIDELKMRSVRATKLHDREDLGSGTRVELVEDPIDATAATGYRLMIDRPKLVYGTIRPARRPHRVKRVQLIICQLYNHESRPLRFVSNFYASHVQCVITGWCAVHLFPGLANRRQAILWKRELTDAVRASISKYRARGYTYQDPAPQLEIPRKRIQTGDGSASVVTFHQLYEEFASYAPDLAGQILHYRSLREICLNMMSWFITNKGELQTNIDKELDEIREFTPPENSLRMFEHVAVHAPEDVDVIRNPRGIGYDHPYRSAIILDLATSGIKIPSKDGGAYSFLL